MRFAPKLRRLALGRRTAVLFQAIGSSARRRCTPISGKTRVETSAAPTSKAAVDESMWSLLDGDRRDRDHQRPLGGSEKDEGRAVSGGRNRAVERSEEHAPHHQEQTPVSSARVGPGDPGQPHQGPDIATRYAPEPDNFFPDTRANARRPSADVALEWKRTTGLEPATFGLGSRAKDEDFLRHVGTGSAANPYPERGRAADAASQAEHRHPVGNRLGEGRADRPQPRKQRLTLKGALGEGANCDPDAPSPGSGSPLHPGTGGLPGARLALSHDHGRANATANRAASIATGRRRPVGPSPSGLAPSAARPSTRRHGRQHAEQPSFGPALATAGRHPMVSPMRAIARSGRSSTRRRRRRCG